MGKAKKKMNFNFGVRAHDMAHGTNISYLASTISNLGIPYIQLVMNKALADASYTDENVKLIKKTCQENGIKIAMLGAYFNLVSPDEGEVKKGLDNFKANLKIMKDVGAGYVGSETGYGKDDDFAKPTVHTEEMYQKSKAAWIELVQEAEKDDAQIAIEPAWPHVIYDIPTLQRLVRELNSPRVHVTVDLYNLLNADNFAKRDEIFLAALKAFKDEVKIIHLKDGIIEDGKKVQLAPGEGQFNYPFMLKTIKEYCPKAVLVFEGVKPERIKESYAYLQKLSKNI